MKIHLIILTVLCLIFNTSLTAQKLEISKPIENALEKSTLYGDEENGYVRVLKDKNDIIVNILEDNTLKTTKSVVNKDILKAKWSSSYIREVGDKIILFTFNFEKDTKNTIYYQVLNIKTGLFAKDVLLINFKNEQDYSDDGIERFKAYESLDKKNIFIVYYQNQDNRDFSKFKINKKNKDFLAFNLIVFNKDLEKVFEKETMFDNLIYSHYFKTFVYDKKNDNVYLSMNYLLRGGEMLSGFAKIYGSDKFAEIVTFPLGKNNQFYSTTFYRNNADKVFIHGTYWDRSKEKYVFFSYDADSEEMDSKEFLIENHPSIKKDILNRKYATISTRVIQVEEYNNELFIAYNLDFSNPRQNGYDRYKHLLNIAIVKLDKEGNIDLLKVIPISEEVYGGLSGKKFCFQAQDNSINGLYVDKYYNYKTEGKELDGNYLTAFTLDDENNIDYKRLSSLKDINNPNYFVLEQCIYSEKTISSFMFIKKKQDLVISVSFD